MGSTYTDSGGIEKIGLGEQAGAWGTTTNNNFDIIDRLINGVGAITLSGTSHTLTTADGSLSDGMFKVLELGGSPSGTNTITIEPDNADKLYFVKNASGQTVTFTQGSGGNVSISNGFGAIIFADGAGSGAKVTDLTALFTTSQAIDGVNIGATTPGTGAFSALTVDNVVINGSNIGHTNDTDLITVASGVVTVAGEVSATTLDIGGTNITATAAELNILDGVTATASELNIMDGVTATTAELNILDGVTATASELNLLDGVSGLVQADFTKLAAVTSSAAELNILDGVTATASELNILDGVTATASELNIMDGGTSATSTTVADADRVVFNDNGTMKQVAVTDLAAYFDDEITAMPNLVTTAATTVGALNSGSITSGFGTINTGSSTITTTGLISGGSLDIDNVLINGSNIGHTDDTDLITVANGIVTVAGELSATTLDIGGTNVTATATELNIMDGVTATTSEINVLDGYTGSVTELNYLDTLHATGVTSSEFDFLDGVTSNIQTQLNTKVTSSGVTSVATGTGLTGGTITSTGTISLDTTLGAVGTYAMLGRTGTGTIIAGQTYTNSSSGADNNNANLVFAGIAGSNTFSDDTAADIRGNSATGVWRAMGHVASSSRNAATLFLRIS
jgi:hypothetical protein